MVNGRFMAKHTGIYGEKSKAGEKTAVKTNSATMYLIQSFDSKGNAVYTSVTGFNNVENYWDEKDCVIDYVRLKNGTAQYVYVRGTADSTRTGNFAFIETASMKWDLKDDIFTVNVTLIDGKEDVIETENGKLAKDLIDNVGKLVYVWYTDGLATAFDVIDKEDKMVKAARLSDVTYDKNDVLTGTYRKDNGDELTEWFNVTTATERYGKLSSDMRDKTVYAIWETGEYKGETYNYIIELYIVDADDQEVPSGADEDVVTYTAKLTTDGKLKVVEYVNGEETAEAVEFTYELYAKFVGTAEYALYDEGDQGTTLDLKETGNYYAVVTIGTKNYKTNAIAFSAAE